MPFLFSLEEQNDIADLSDEKVLALSVAAPSFFKIIVDRYQSAFIRKAERIIGKREEAEDVVQDAFTKIYLNASRFKVQEGATFKSWAYKILIHTTFTRYKKLKKENEFRIQLDPEILEIIPDLDNLMLEKESLRDAIVSILSQMPVKLRRVLEQYYLEDRAQKDIAAEEGVAIGVIKTRVSRAKQVFKKINLLTTGEV
jgi:RNA polymerase sigma-70 factor (ECF subfamily)